MDCRELEIRLESLVGRELPETERLGCERHLAGCPDCRDLARLARLPEPGGPGEAPDLVGEILEQTTGAACDRARRLLALNLEGRLPTVEGALLAGHLGDCGECRALAGALAALERDLPRLASARPDTRFVDDVLRATLPVNVQLRRWWTRSWPRWLHRPRFASEAAYVGLLVLVLVFATPGSPLEAVPQRALAAARTAPAPSLGGPVAALEQRLASTAEALRGSEGAETLATWRTAATERLRAARAAAAWVVARLGTFWHDVASLLGRTDEPEPSETPHPTEETP